MHHRKYFNQFAASLLLFLSAASAARAQSPSQVSGSAIAFAVADGTAPFSSYGYYFLMPADSGNAYQIVNIAGTVKSTGNYSYSANNTNSIITLADSVMGQNSITLEFDDVDFGVYTASNTASSGEQDGNFILFAGQTPTTVAGKTFSYTVNDGVAPFASTGSGIISFAASGNKYTITGDGVSVPNSSGTYTYFKINSASGKIVMSDSVTGISMMVLAFIDSQNGSFGTRQSGTPNYQVGDFKILDTRPPTIAVNYPTPGLITSNEVITVSGRAADNYSVADVLYSLNGADWIEASPTNNWSGWFAQVISNPGTNIFSVYSVDGSGNYSQTNTVTYVYVVSAPFTAQMVGLGTISPNYNNALLKLGANYRVVASGNSGFAFTNWSDANGNIITNSPTLMFMMNYGSAYTATFVDVQKPTINIQYPAHDLRVSNSVFNVTGKAGDNASVSSVNFSLNGSDWTPVNSANGWTNWNAMLGLNPGSNTFQVYAVDSSGNISKTNSITLFYVLSAPLSLQVTGRGSIKPDYNNAFLPVGTTYSLAATPLAGFAFTNWSDGNGNIIASQPNLRFLMTSNLLYIANFVDVAKPKLAIASKLTTINVYNEFYIVNGTASDNVSVTNVFFSLNRNGWNTPNTGNQWANWSTTLDLNPGTNWFSAYAVDPSGNISATNNLILVYNTSPKTAGNLQAVFTPNTGSSYSISIGGGRFGLYSPDTNRQSCVGTYKYLKTSPTDASLTLGFVAPPSAAASGNQNVTISFISPTTGNYVNANTGESGSVVFAQITNLVIPTVSYHTVYEISDSGSGAATYYNASRFVSTDLVTRNSFTGMSFSYAAYGPAAALLKKVSGNGTSYIISNYTGSNHGLTHSATYDKYENLLGIDDGFFGIASSQSSGLAPTALMNSSVNFASDGDTFNDSFSAISFGQESTNAAFTYGAGNYNYTASNNAGGLTLNYLLPPQVSGGSSYTTLNFFAPDLAYFTNADQTVGFAVVSAATNYTMLSSLPANLLVTNAINGDLDQLQLANNGTFSVSGDWPGDGTCTLTSFSPVTEMVQLTFSDGSYAGDFGWLQLTYNSPAGGSYMITFYDGGNNLLGTESGTFGQQ